MTVEEMRAELEAAEWRFVVSDTGSYFIQVIMPNGFDKIYNADFETTPEQCLKNAVGDAYAHLEKEREFEAMKAMISELRGVLSHCLMTLKRTMYTDTPNDIETAIDRAEKILYKKNNEF